MLFYHKKKITNQKVITNIIIIVFTKKMLKKFKHKHQLNENKYHEQT